MQSPNASCQCLNENYLPAPILGLLNDESHGWSYKRGRFALDLKHQYEVIDVVRDYSRALRFFKINPVFLTIKDNMHQNIFHFTVFEDEIYRSVFDYNIEAEIRQCVESVFSSRH